jgi:hypothetical protein
MDASPAAAQHISIADQERQSDADLPENYVPA